MGFCFVREVWPEKKRNVGKAKQTITKINYKQNGNKKNKPGKGVEGSGKGEWRWLACVEILD